MYAYRYKHVAYVPFLKNASSTFTTFFEEHGWEKISTYELKTISDIKIFGHIQNPDVRHTKGIAELINIRKCPNVLKETALAVFVCSGVYDDHTYPFDLTHNDIISLRDKIHWIPMDLVFEKEKINCNDLTNLFFKEHNLPFIIYDQKNQNVAYPEKTDLQNKIKQIKQRHAKKIYPTLNIALKRDIELWNNWCNYYIIYLEQLKNEDTPISREWKRIKDERKQNSKKKKP